MRSLGLLIHAFDGFCPELTKKYGPVFTIWLGAKPMVVICGYEAVKDALVTHNAEFGLLTEHEKWKILHRFTLTTLRNFGMGMRSMAEWILEETHCQPFDTIPTIIASVSNMYSALPNIMKFLPGPHNKIFSDCKRICDFIRSKVDAHKGTLDPENPGDFIDCFLLKLEKGKDSSVICVEDLCLCLSSSSLGQIAQAVQSHTALSFWQGFQISKEIDEVVGPNCGPCMEDKIKLSYINALVHEILHYAQAGIENFPCMTTQDVNFRGHFIPQFQQARGRLPPGPRPWLFLGNLLQKDIFPLYKTYPKLSKKYGPVFTIWIGSKPMVVICGYEAVKSALVTHSEEFGGRPPVPVLHQVTKGNGLISENKKWKIMRRFTLATLRNFGMGRKSMAERISEEANRLVKKITTFEELYPTFKHTTQRSAHDIPVSICLSITILRHGQPFDIVPPITSIVSNVFCSVIFGNKLSYEGKTSSELLEILEEFTGFFSSPLGMVYSTLPNILKFFPGPHKKVFSDCNKVCDFIRNKVDAHKKTLDPDNPRDFIDCFLLKLEKEEDSSILSIEDLVMSVFELFVAGTDSTWIFISYGLNLLARFPNVQAKAQEEIDDVVGANRSPSIEDRMKLPYINAFVHEILRFPQISIENFPRMTTQDVNFRGHFIPQGTTVLPLGVSVHFDSLCWEDPEMFDPGHFLDEKGKFQKKDAYIPFSAGKRACPGEALADMEIFLVFAILLQHFTFELPTDTEEIDLQDLFMGCRMNGKYHYLRAIKRKM
ncbi:Cytochrome protein, partial [Ophiophagus hannah]